jgi:hypothetical protein
LKGWSNIVIHNPEIRSALKELQMIYLQNITVGPEMKLFLLTSMLAFVFHNSSNNIDDEYNKQNIKEQFSHFK